jgi:hypothetical protein
MIRSRRHARAQFISSLLARSGVRDRSATMASASSELGFEWDAAAASSYAAAASSDGAAGAATAPPRRRCSAPPRPELQDGALSVERELVVERAETTLAAFVEEILSLIRKVDFGELSARAVDPGTLAAPSGTEAERW